MKKENWSSIKEMVFAYLAISKMLYWISIIPTVNNLQGMGRVVLERLLERDFVLITFIVGIHFFEKKFILQQDRWRGVSGQIMLAISGYGMFTIILLTFIWGVGLILSTPVNMGELLSGPYMRNMTMIYFIIFGAMTVKEHFKKKEASEYALDIQSTNIKLEMLKTLLEDGALSQEEFDKQKVKLLL